MANAIYPKWKEAVMQAGSNSSLGGTVKAVLSRSAQYTYNAAHEFLSSVTGYHTTLSDALSGKTYTSGAFDAADFKFTGPASTGNSYDQVLIVIDTGSAATTRLVAFYDTGVTGLPVTPSGGDINVTVNASGFFTL